MDYLKLMFNKTDDGFLKYDDALKSNEDAFTYNTTVDVKDKKSGKITSGAFTNGTFYPTTFEIIDASNEKHKFNKNDVLIKIIEANTNSGYSGNGGKKTYRKTKKSRKTKSRKNKRRSNRRRR